MQITITNVERKTSQKSGKPYVTVTDTNGARYSIWDSVLCGKVSQGQTYEVTTKDNGNYKNILTLSQHNHHSMVAPTEQAEARRTKLSLIQSAADLVGNLKHGTNGNPMDAAVEVFEIAKNWETAMEAKEPEPDEKALY